MSRPDLTIVVPTHDRVELLPATLESVLVERGLDLQVVVVDDRSTDGTEAWLDGCDDPRLEVVRLDPGRGGSGARNVGLERAAAPLVMFLDDDDLVRRGALVELCAVATAHPAAVVAGGTYVSFGAEHTQRRQPHVRRVTVAPIWREQLFGWNLQPGAGVWRTEFVRSIGGWNTSLARCEDLDLNLRTHGHDAVLVPTVAVYYRYHEGQLDDDRRRAELALDAEVRTGFVDALADPDREVGRRVLDARRAYLEGHDAYVDDAVALAARRFFEMLRTAPELARSPILGRWLLGLQAKAVAATAVPPSLRRTIRARRRRRRAEALAEASPPP